MPIFMQQSIGALGRREVLFPSLLAEGTSASREDFYESRGEILLSKWVFYFISFCFVLFYFNLFYFIGIHW